MSNVKVKGVLDENGVKNFMITNKDTGETHVALRDGQKFLLGEFKGTLAQCKQLVSEDKVVHFADAPPEPESNHSSWDCVHPCALLIKLWTEPHIEYMPEGLTDEISRTLDSFGWLDRDGMLDIDAAQDNYDKWRKR